MPSPTDAALVAWSECHPEGVTLPEERLPVLLPSIAVRVPGALASAESARRLNAYFNAGVQQADEPAAFLQMLRPAAGRVYFLHFWRAFADVTQLVAPKKKAKRTKHNVILLECERIRDQVIDRLVEDHVDAKVVIDAVQAVAKTSKMGAFWNTVKDSVASLESGNQTLHVEELSTRMISWLHDASNWHMSQDKENAPANLQMRPSISRLSTRLSSWKRMSRGKTSMLGAEPSSLVQDCGLQVYLHIYDVSMEQGIRKLNRILANKLSPLKLGGVFHAGVEVNGLEWSYGFSTSETLPGVACEEPKQHPHHHYRQTIALKKTSIKAEDVADIISDLIEDYPGDDYDLLRRNCCHFADDFCKRLGVGRIPRWVHRLARLGARLDGAMQIASGLHSKFRGVLVPEDAGIDSEESEEEDMDEDLKNCQDQASQVATASI